MTEYTALAISNVTELATIVRELRDKVFIPDNDFGVIPGTSGKPVLLLPGMEKLMRALRLVPKYVPLTVIEDFDKPLFLYRYECQLIEQETGLIVGSAIGSANSHESKWRWREQKRACPLCGQPTINKSKDKPEWYCWKKIGGCGKTYPENDTAITSQVIGRVENPDVADQMNTIDKIAQKRSLSSAIKTAANVSEFFTVDMEDLPSFGNASEPDSEFILGTARNTPASPPARQNEPQGTNTPKAAENVNYGAMSDKARDALIAAVGKVSKASSQERYNTVNKMRDEGVFANMPEGSTVDDMVTLVLERLLAHGATQEIF